MILASVLLLPVQDRNGGEIHESLLARLVSPAEIYTQPPKVSSLRGRRQPPPVLPPSPVAPSIPSAAIPPPPQTAYTPAPIPQVAPKPDSPKPSIKEKLFDRNVINDLAKRDMEKKEQAKKDKIPLLDTRQEQTYGSKGGLQNRDDKKSEADKKLSFDGKELKFMLYDRKLKERIEHIWIYPPSAAARGISGDLLIRFTIMKNGKLGAVDLVRTSGHKDLDDAAIKALKDASPFWPLPESWGMDSYSIDGHFIYTIIYNI